MQFKYVVNAAQFMVNEYNKAPQPQVINHRIHAINSEFELRYLIMVNCVELQSLILFINHLI